MNKYLFFFTLFFCFLFHQNQSLAQFEVFKQITISTDSSVSNLTTDTIMVKGRPLLPFEYFSENQVVLVDLELSELVAPDYLRILHSGDFEVIDSLQRLETRQYRMKVKFRDLTNSSFLQFTFEMVNNADKQIIIRSVRLQPYYKTKVSLDVKNDELFIGEEKIYELNTNNAENIRVNPLWNTAGDINYRTSYRNGQVRLHLSPTALKSVDLNVTLQTKKPSLTTDGKLTYNLPPLTSKFNVRNSRLMYVNFDINEVTLDEESGKGIEVTIDAPRDLVVNKTYRIENQEEPGGYPVGELFVRRELSNDKALCWLRVFNLHRKTSGYLYIKDGDRPRYITNFAITPKTQINRLLVLHEGGDWVSNPAVNPGEIVDVRIEGQGLHKGKFHFDGVENIFDDSLLNTENVVTKRIKIPLRYPKNKIGLFNQGEKTGHELTIREFQSPRPFDWISVNWGERDQKLSSIKKVVLYDKEIKDVVFSFDHNIIDSEAKLYGKQYFTIEVVIRGKRKELIEMKEINNLLVCPGEKSPRSAFYQDKQNLKADLFLNSYLGRKTHELDDWSRIEITVKHQTDKYGGEGFSQKIEIVLQELITFDIDLSFPAGLIIQKVGQDNFNQLSGISLAMIAQFDFYQPGKINKMRPYKIGAGFLALNAFDFSQNASRDLGAVLIGSLYPIRRDARLTFPLHVGFGYFLQEEVFFYMVGPGIRLRI